MHIIKTKFHSNYLMQKSWKYPMLSYLEMTYLKHYMILVHEDASWYPSCIILYALVQFPLSFPISKISLSSNFVS